MSVAKENKVRNCGLVFVHGIAQGPDERATMFDRVHQIVKDGGLSEMFDPGLIGCAQWRSLGSWTDDLADLGLHKFRCQEAEEDVARQIDQMRWRVAGETTRDNPGGLVVVGHSMGQILSALALKRLVETAKETPLPVEITLVTVGGPLGNKGVSALFLKDAYKELMTQKDKLQLHWVDIWNPDDPVCCDPIFGYNKPSFVDTAIKVEAPGSPDPLRPTMEHSTYFVLPGFLEQVKKAALEVCP